MATKSILTAERLRELLHYDPNTGIFRWKQSGSGRKATGIAGAINITHSGKIRIIITIDYKVYKAHRLAWLYVHGSWPDRQIDHINDDASDNRWINLRLATRQQQRWNRGIARNNTSGLTGAHYDRTVQKWCAAISGKSLGHFKTKEEAHEAYRQAALEKYGEFAHSSLTQDPDRPAAAH